MILAKSVSSSQVFNEIIMLLVNNTMEGLSFGFWICLIDFNASLLILNHLNDL